MVRQPVNVVVCGHVDHGKSTLIGRLLHDSGSLTPHQREEFAKQNDKDFSMIMDSLEEERRKGKTIDVMHATLKGRLNLIDVPGHKEFIRNMATGSSQAQAAVLIVSAKSGEGVQEQTRRHAFLLGFLGIRQVIVAVNKMDSEGFRRDAFERVVKETKKLTERFGFPDILFIPVSAKEGDNLLQRSPRMEWYKGPSLIDCLEMVNPPQNLLDKPLRLPIQSAHEIEGKMIFLGRVESGILEAGEEVLFQPSGIKAEVKEIHGGGGKAVPGDSIGFEARGERVGDVTRGQVCSKIIEPARETTSITGKVFLLGKDAIENERLFLVLGTSETPVSVKRILKRINTETAEPIEGEHDHINPGEAAIIEIGLEHPIVAERFSRIPGLGRFLLLKDKRTSAAGTVSNLS